MTIKKFCAKNTCNEMYCSDQPKEEPNDLGELLSYIVSTYYKGDVETSGEYLKHLCNNSTPDFLRQVFGHDSNLMMDWYCIFNDTGLAEEPDETPSRKAFINLNSYICNCDNPRIKKALDDAFKHCYPDLKSSGCDERGEVYLLSDLAKISTTYKNSNHKPAPKECHCSIEHGFGFCFFSHSVAGNA